MKLFLHVFFICYSQASCITTCHRIEKNTAYLVHETSWIENELQTISSMLKSLIPQSPSSPPLPPLPPPHPPDLPDPPKFPAPDASFTFIQHETNNTIVSFKETLIIASLFLLCGACNACTRRINYKKSEESLF